MQGFKAGEHVSQYYGSNTAFAAILDRQEGFEYASWSDLTLAEALARLDPSVRERAEDALNGWKLPDRKLTQRQEQFVASHSGKNRLASVREALANVGQDAMALMAEGNIAEARKLLRHAGLPPSVIAVFLAGWKQEFMEHELDEQPAVCAIVNAMNHKTYVGRIVKIDDVVVWQEVEPGQIVEHKRTGLGEFPAVIMADPYYQQNDNVPDELHSPWLHSWCISYDAEGRAEVKTAQLVLFNAHSVKPNPFKGRIVGDTSRRFIQQNSEVVYSGHLKSMTGELEIGRSYELQYHGPLGKQTIEVKALQTECAPKAIPHAAQQSVAAPTQQVAAVPASVQAVSSVQAGREWWKLESGENAVEVCGGFFKRHDVVVTPRNLVQCLEHERHNESYSGHILEVNKERGLVVQSLGRRQATVHLLEDFKEEPEMGAYLDIKYVNGQMAEVKEKGLSKSIAR